MNNFRRINIELVDIVMATLAIGIVLLGVFMGFTLYQQGLIKDTTSQLDKAQVQIARNQKRLVSQQKSLTYLEKRDRINSYQTAYRFCSRINITRASIQWFVSLSVRGAPSKAERRRARRILAKLREKGGSPVLDCSPNTVGGPAKYQSPREQARFVRRWARDRLSPAEIGICRVRIGTLEPPRACLN